MRYVLIHKYENQCPGGSIENFMFESSIKVNTIGNVEFKNEQIQCAEITELIK